MGRVRQESEAYTPTTTSLATTATVLNRGGSDSRAVPADVVAGQHDAGDAEHVPAEHSTAELTEMLPVGELTTKSQIRLAEHVARTSQLDTPAPGGGVTTRRLSEHETRELQDRCVRGGRDAGLAQPARAALGRDA